MEPENLTREELERLEAVKTEDEWNDACTAVKTARGGHYPNDWYQRVLKSGLARVLRRFGETTEIQFSWRPVK